jgi:hydroxymethylbilane synthase
VCRAALAVLDDAATHSAVFAERSLLRKLGGGCHMPVGARGIVNGEELTLHAAVVSPDGTRRLACRRTGRRADCEAVGIAVGTKLLSQGAEEILKLKGERPIDH